MAGEYINDEVFDQGLDYADTNGTRIDITSQVATTYAEATSTYTLGNKTGLNTGATEAGDTDGRKVVVPAIADGSVTGTDTATHWALTDGSSILVATGPLTASQGVTSGNTFTLDAIDITIRDAA
ncbi:MAG: hypothetical protein GY727_16740 [Gammaproteobacteria bacterium]|nr:hypothetical protein [Gammaproteobacteria bacterium]MCP4275838.1 hypothetical protein [Gammaproteobacteria bacterium]